MIRFFYLNRSPIANLTKIFLITYGILSLLIAIVGYYSQGLILVMYPLIFTFSCTFFSTLAITLLEYTRSIKENTLFRKAPYNSIEDIISKTEYIQDSKYDFFKKQRIISLDQDKYKIIFFSNIVRNPFGNALVVLKEKKGEEKAILHLIDYKNKKFNEFSLFTELRNISE